MSRSSRRRRRSIGFCGSTFSASGTGCSPASGAHCAATVRRGQAASIVLYDPDRESVVLVEQFRLPALLAGSSPWQLEAAAGLVDSGETPAAVAVRETQE